MKNENKRTNNLKTNIDNQGFSEAQLNQIASLVKYVLQESLPPLLEVLVNKKMVSVDEKISKVKIRLANLEKRLANFEKEMRKINIAINQ